MSRVPTKQFRHPEAVFFTSAGVRHPLPIDAIRTADDRARFSRIPLFNPSLALRLHIKKRKNFYFSKSGVSPIRTGRDPNSPLHEQRIEELCISLTTRPSWTAVASAPIGDGTFWPSVLLDDARYSWQRGTRQTAHDGGTFIHDIESIDPTNKLNSSTPAARIEVIVTHCPEVDSFRRMKKVTEITKSVIFFDFPLIPDCSILLNHDDGLLSSRYYMYAGSLWRNKDRLQYDGSRFIEHVRELDVIQRALSKITNPAA